MAKGTLIHRTPALASRGRHCFPKRLRQQGKRIGGMRRSVVRQAPLIFYVPEADTIQPESVQHLAGVGWGMQQQ